MDSHRRRISRAERRLAESAAGCRRGAWLAAWDKQTCGWNAEQWNQWKRETVAVLLEHPEVEASLGELEPGCDVCAGLDVLGIGVSNHQLAEHLELEEGSQ